MKTSPAKNHTLKEIQYSKPIQSARELLNDFIKLLVTGSAKQEIQIMLNENIESNKFDMVITGDDLGQGLGKPDPTSFKIALQRMNLSPLERYSSSKFENSPYHITSLASSIMSNIG